MNSSRPGLPAIISVMLGLQKEIEQNQEEITEIKQKLEELDS